MKSITYCIKTLIIFAWVIFSYKTVKFTTFTVLCAIVFLIISDMTQSLVHEFGHLIGGWVSGYHFLSLHFGPFEIYKNKLYENCVSFSFNKNEIYGQCLMIPNISNTNKYGLYNIAGIFFNLITVSLSATYLLFSHNTSPVKLIFILSLIITGINKIVANIVPHLKKESPNDMLIIAWLSSSKKTKFDYFNYLRTYEKVVYGFQPEYDSSITIKFNQKDIDHYNSYFANAKNKLTCFDTAVNLTKNP